ncbi:MAG: mannonate dehydratase [Chloroflexi bacterium]|nr:mannonate dehydratase [Chloroflexota bacterium]
MQLGLGAIHVAANALQEIDERLTFARQLGVENIIIHTPELPGDGYWEFRPLLMMRTYVEAAGLKLYAIENMPRNFYDKVRLGLPGRDEQLENVRKTIRNMGRAGIHCLGYDFNLVGVWRTGRAPTATSRGRAAVTSYDHELAKNAPLFELGRFDDETMWKNYEYFLKAVIPVAEEEGVRLALHPDDPPVPEIAGTARIFRSTEAYKRVIEIVDSPSNALEFCQGTVAEWCKTPEEVYEAIRYFASRDKIAYVHFRNVRGVVPRFEETFIDDGKVDMLKAMRAYKESGFKGVFIADHTPGIVGDTPWGHRGRAYAIGYMKALLKCVNG